MHNLYTVESGNLNILTLAEKPGEAVSKFVEYFLKNQDMLYLGKIIIVTKGEESWIASTELSINNYHKKEEKD